jgi:sugar phosphate isomerase/epimerase
VRQPQGAGSRQPVWSSVRIGISTACLYGFPLRYTLRLAADCGFDGIELVMAPEIRLRGAGGVERLCRAYGLDILAVHVALLPPGALKNNAKGLVDATRMAIELTAPSVVFHGPFADWATRRTQRWLDALDLCQRMADGTTTRLALENVGVYGGEESADVMGSIPILCSFARLYDLYLTLDTCHVGNSPLGLMETYVQMRPRLVNVHLSDYAQIATWTASGVHGHQLPIGRHGLYAEHQLPGEGDLPLREFLARLKQDHYAGTVNLEIGPAALRVWSPRKTRQRLGQARDFIAQARAERQPSPRVT